MVVPRVAVCEPSLCRRIALPACTSARPDPTAEVRRRIPQESIRARAQSSRSTRPRSWSTTIAATMLAPCSASSMLCASLRPGRWPGLRALTTPARGTDWQLRDGGQRDDRSNGVDASITRAYVDFITSVPHGTPPVRRNGLRSAYSADALRARFRAHPSRHRSQSQDHGERLVCTPVGCELHGLLPAPRSQDRARRRDSVHQRHDHALVLLNAR